jgi:hypothetical protein
MRFARNMASQIRPRKGAHDENLSKIDKAHDRTKGGRGK